MLMIPLSSNPTKMLHKFSENYSHLHEDFGPLALALTRRNVEVRLNVEGAGAHAGQVSARGTRRESCLPASLSLSLPSHPSLPLPLSSLPLGEDTRAASDRMRRSAQRVEIPPRVECLVFLMGTKHPGNL